MGRLEDAILEGTRVEMEHTPNELTAARIALDHLTEDPDYYAKLRAVESGAVGKGLTGSGHSCYNGNKKGDDMDAAVRKALDGTKALIRVAKAAMPEGTVSHRKDGDWKKTGGQWVRLPAQERQGQGSGAPKKPEGGDKFRGGEIRSMMKQFGGIPGSHTMVERTPEMDSFIKRAKAAGLVTEAEGRGDARWAYVAPTQAGLKAARADAAERQGQSGGAAPKKLSGTELAERILASPGKYGADAMDKASRYLEQHKPKAAPAAGYLNSENRG